MLNLFVSQDKPIEEIRVGLRVLQLRLVRNSRARRYVMRLGTEGVIRVTVPRGGTTSGARSFALRNLPWLERQLQKRADRPAAMLGSEVLVRGEKVRIEAGSEDGCVRLGNELLRLSGPESDIRLALQRHLARLAREELPVRVVELAAEHGLQIGRISVRNQRSRWGSCSTRGTISLNWRLIQVPDFVRDYIILHELAHLRQMNHSKAFWAEVRRLCPGYEGAEAWLKQHSALLSW